MINRCLVYLLSSILVITSCSPNEILYQTETASSTPTKTQTLIITITPKQELRLRNIFISNEDINEILAGDYYNSDLIILNDETINNIELAEGGFASTIGDGKIWITLIRLMDGSSCSGIALAIKDELSKNKSEDISTMLGLFLPEDIWFINTKEDNHLHAGFSKGNICTEIEYQIPSGLSSDDTIIFLSLITQKQYYKIEDMGY